MAGLDDRLLDEGLSKLRQASVVGLSSYPTPAQAALYIGYYHVDDAYSVEWEMTDSTIPLHTYFDTKWVTAVKGKEMVSGNLSIDFRYPGYLAHAIKARRETASSEMKTSNEIVNEARKGSDDYIAEYLRIMTSGTLDDRVRALRDAAARGPEVLRKVSALGLLSSYPLKTRQGVVRYTDVFEEQNTYMNRILPVDIWIHYGGLDTTHSADIIKDVVFTGKAKQIQAGAVGSGGTSVSGMNLLEVYSFFARSVEQRVINRDAQS